jgi:hypothetical protein
MRRLAFILCWSIVVGLVANVIVALIAAYVAQRSPSSVRFPSMDERLALHRRSKLEPPFGVMAMGDTGLMQSFGYREIRMWAFGYDVPASSGSPMHMKQLLVSEGEAGWPLRSLRFMEIRPRGPREPEVFSAQPMVTSTTWPSPRLPMKPIWPEFAINSLIYAAAIAVVPLVRLARRLIRKRLGLCEACGYPKGQNPRCTECGRTLVVED